MTELQTMPLRFRVWDKDTNNWCHSSVIFDDIKWDAPGGGKIEFVSTDPSLIISQDTGVKDKNGKSIFTGDVVRVKGFGQDTVGVVECHYGECRIHYESGLQESLVFNVGREVIGNIWEGTNEN